MPAPLTVAVCQFVPLASDHLMKGVLPEIQQFAVLVHDAPYQRAVPAKARVQLAALLVVRQM